MHSKALIDVLKKPLALTDNATLSVLSGGAINRSYYLSDDLNEYLLKHFQGEDVLDIDRQERFDLQLQLSLKGLAPAPIYLSVEHGIYVEQWINQDQSQLRVCFKKLHIKKLVEALSRVHQSEVESKLVDLPTSWQQYLTSLPYPSSNLMEQVRALTEQWIRCNESYPAERVFCHNDLVWAHLCAPSEIILDWEYAGMGNRYFDLLSCAKVNGFSAQQYDDLLMAYSNINEIPIDQVYSGCQRQASFIDLTYQLWYQAAGIN